MVEKKNRSKENKELVERLAQTGLSKNVARALVFIAGVDETTSRNIEDHTRLRQPEVSIATNQLRSLGWIEKRDIKKEGKGRPVHGYRLKKPIGEILEDIEEDEMEKVKEIKNNVKRMKELAETTL